VSSVKRKKKIKSYGGFAQGASKNLIGPLTENAYAYTRERVKRKAYDTGKLYRNIRREVHKSSNGFWGILKAGGPGAKHANLIQYGVGPHIIRSKDSNAQNALMVPGVGPREYVFHPGFKGTNFMRYGINKARREMRRLWKQSMEKTYAEQKR